MYPPSLSLRHFRLADVPGVMAHSSTPDVEDCLSECQPRAGSGKQTVDRAAIIDQFHGSALTGVDFLVGIDAQSVTDRCVDVRNVDGIVFWHATILVARSDHGSTFDAATRHEAAEAFWPVVASGVFVDAWSAAKF